MNPCPPANIRAGEDVELSFSGQGAAQDYAEAVIDHTLAVLATLTTTEDVIAAWS